VTPRPFLVFLMAVILTAIFVSPVSSDEIPCVPPESAAAFEPIEHVKGFGIRDGGLVKLSVSSEGYFMITLSPADLGGAVCVVMMGTKWSFVKRPAGEKVQYGRRD
jgi:hypothetical protein